jgi:uncharacterized membrane protein YphA (DoxX/SURF4 family)
MKANNITYWITTTFLAGDMALAGVLYLTHVPMLMNAFAHLGYPAYFANILGVAKILGALALLAPGLPRLKEWAYAGFAITFISAFISHIVSGDGLFGTNGFGALAPCIAFSVLITSYVTRPANRRAFHPIYSAKAGAQTSQMGR